MTVKIDTDARITKVRVQEQASNPSAPAAGYGFVFEKDDQELYFEGASGTVQRISGGMELIQRQTTPTSTGTMVFAAIPTRFSKLIIEYAFRGTAAATEVSMDLVLNGDTTDANYRRQAWTAYATASGGTTGDDNIVDDAVIADNGPASEFSMGVIEIPYYTSGFNKQARYRNSKRRDTNSVHEQINIGALDWESTAVVGSISLVLSSGNFAALSIASLYGVY